MRFWKPVSYGVAWGWNSLLYYSETEKNLYMDDEAEEVLEDEEDIVNPAEQLHLLRSLSKVS